MLDSLADSDQWAQEWLHNCYESVKGRELLEAEANRRPKFKWVTSKRLLLIGAPRSPMARFWRVLYWIFLLLFNLFLTYSVVEIFAGVKDAGYALFGAFLFFGGPAFLFAVISRGAENSHKSKANTDESPHPWSGPHTPGSSGSTQKGKCR